MNDPHGFLEFMSRKVMKIVIPVLMTLFIDSIITRSVDIGWDPKVSSRIRDSSVITAVKNASIGQSFFIAVSFIIITVVSTGLVLFFYFINLTRVIYASLVVIISALVWYSVSRILLKIAFLTNTPMDAVSTNLVIVNLIVVGNMAIFCAAPHTVTQLFLMMVSVLATMFVLDISDWTLWLILIFLIIYDCIVVLCPHGLLKVLIAKTQERGDSIPALVYSTAAYQSSDGELSQSGNVTDGSEPDVEFEDDDGSIQPLPQGVDDIVLSDSDLPNEYPLNRTQRDTGIKLGLGDFIFYGALITRAARIGWDFVLVCSSGIIIGLLLTLICLVVVQKPLPALPFSLVLGMVLLIVASWSYRSYSNVFRQNLFVF